MAKENYLFYKFVAFVIRNIGHFFLLDKVEGGENIPKEGRCILAGNHISVLDFIFFFRGTKRVVHILGKIELFRGPFGFLFKWMHLIPVDRSRKSPEVIRESVKILENEEVIGIFPEGTTQKEGVLLPFKPGAIKMSLEAKAPIVPFAIVGKMRFWGRPKVIFGKPIYLEEVKDDDKLGYLENVIAKMIKENS